MATSDTIIIDGQTVSKSALRAWMDNPEIKGGIKFPATQVPSADPNTLDDYEEGDFTPQLNFGGGHTGMTTSVAAGRYTKVGRMVRIDLQITLTAKGSSTGSATITGLPFANNASLGAVMNMLGVTMTTVASLGGITVLSAATINLYDFTSSSITALTHGDFGDTTVLYVSGTYTV